MPDLSHEQRDDGISSLAQPGTLLAGKYRVEQVIGSGAMGIVLSAIHVHLRERVAIKLLLPETARSEEGAARFLREARAAVRIKSEHVARVMDAGMLETGAPFIAMEYLEGSDLLATIRAHGPLSVEFAVDLTLQVCEALAEAHMVGIIHRDLKPSNLFLTTRADGSPCVKVLDFGISKITSANTGASDAAMTKTRVALGSPAYMSPEQMRSSKDVDARTDIWSLGATLYELLTATKPFMAPTIPQVCALILEAAVPSMRAIRPEIPPALEAVIGRCLAKHPDQRYANVAELATALAPFGSPTAWRPAERVSRIKPGAGRGSHPLLPSLAQDLARQAHDLSAPVTTPLPRPALATTEKLPAAALDQTQEPPTNRLPPMGAVPQVVSTSQTGAGVSRGTLPEANKTSKMAIAISVVVGAAAVGGLTTVVSVAWLRNTAGETPSPSSSVAPATIPVASGTPEPATPERSAERTAPAAPENSAPAPAVSAETPRSDPQATASSHATRADKSSERVPAPRPGKDPPPEPPKPKPLYSRD